MPRFKSISIPAAFLRDGCQRRRQDNHASTIHFLALIPDDRIIASHLRARPVRRGSGSQKYIDNHLEFNRWLREVGPEQGIELLAATNRPVEVVATGVLNWARGLS